MKKVLFISIGFYDYDLAIKSQFKKMGYNVDFFSEVPKQTFKYKYYKRTKNTKGHNSIVEQHTSSIIDESVKNYDLVFIIKCENLSNTDILALREKSPNAKFVLYLWDSINRILGISDKIELFDKVFSFDRLDCLSNNKLIFNPLFFREEYDNGSLIEEKQYYDIYHLGWYHSDRFKIIKKISKYLDNNKLRYKLILFTGYFNFLLQSIFGGELKGNRKNLIFKSINSKEKFDNIQKSKAILDIAHPLQNGLTMRTIELLGMQKKIITTNKEIVNYDFYNPNNVLIIDRENPCLDLSFFKTNYKKIPEDIRLKYSITNWLSRMV